jgi:hypothetical protein
MRSLRQATYELAWPSLRNTQGRLLGLPFVLAACASGVVFGWPASMVALLIASLASFLLFVPLTALALNGGAAIPEDAPTPALTPWAYGVLLVLWTATVWAAAGFASHGQ